MPERFLGGGEVLLFDVNMPEPQPGVGIPGVQPESVLKHLLCSGELAGAQLAHAPLKLFPAWGGTPRRSTLTIAIAQITEVLARLGTKSSFRGIV